MYSNNGKETYVVLQRKKFPIWYLNDKIGSINSQRV